MLPASLIPEGFEAVQDFAAEPQVNSSKMMKLFAYFRRTWILGEKPANFSVYGRLYRTKTIQ
jgi:hypothetical protein